MLILSQEGTHAPFFKAVAFQALIWEELSLKWNLDLRTGILSSVKCLLSRRTGDWWFCLCKYRDFWYINVMKWFAQIDYKICKACYAK